MYRNALLVLLQIVTASLLTAQISIDQDDMPSPGDTIRMSTALNLDFIDYTETGEDFFWDFSDLVSITQRVDTFVTVLQTPLFYWPFFLTSANLASPIIEDSLLPGLPLTNVYQFYNSSNSNYKDAGFAATISGIPLPIKYDDPDILYEFPMVFGNVDSSHSGLELGLPDIAFVLIDKQRKNTVDGWGTLATPYGTFDVLRVKSEVTEYDSIYVDSLQIGIPLTREYIEYKWLGKDFGLPLLSVTDDLFGLVVEYIDSLSSETVSVKDLYATNNNVAVFPNPVRDLLSAQITMDEPGTIEVRLTDLKGKLIIRENVVGKIGNNEVKVDFSAINCNTGTYILVLRANNKTFSQKIIYSN